MTAVPVIDPSLLVLWGLVLILAVITLIKKGKEGVLMGFRHAWDLIRMMMRMLPFALLMAVFLAEILPNELVGGWIGGDTGFQGLVIASVAGGLVPAGPYVAFPIALTLLNSGAGVPQLIAFITSWSLVAVHRIVALELPMMGWRFVAVRLVTTLPLPLLSGTLALWAWSYVGAGIALP